MVKFCDILLDGDCIEIYRFFIVDLKEICKCRVEKVKEEGRVDKVMGGKVNLFKVKF